MNWTTRNILPAQTGLPRREPLDVQSAGEIHATAMGAAQFDAGLTLVASIHAVDRTRPILICDLGLTAAQRAALDLVATVSIFHPAPGLLRAEAPQPERRVALMRQIFEMVGRDIRVLWLDPDIALYRPLDPVFEMIGAEGGVLSSTRPGVAPGAGAGVDSGCFGIRLNREAAALLGACADGPALAGDSATLAEFARKAGLRVHPGGTLISDLDDLTEAQAPRAGRLAGPPAPRLRRGDVSPDTALLRHRGILKDFSGLWFAYPRKRLCGILGNGPSLAGVDLTSLDDMDTIGMNAAMRFWHKIGWYPTLYCCLDEVVGLSLRDEILDLVVNRRTYGIEQFIVRQNLFDWLDSQGATDGVICFDIMREGYDVLMSTPMTTGSHATGWAVISGYDRLMLAGIDGNYVEQVPGSRVQDEIVMEIVADEDNPNYFFDGYQQVGDMYLKPNPSDDMHLRSWYRIRRRFPDGVLVVNGNPASRVDAFPRMDIATARKSLTLSK